MSNRKTGLVSANNSQEMGYSWFGSAATTKHLSHPVTYYPKSCPTDQYLYFWAQLSIGTQYSEKTVPCVHVCMLSAARMWENTLSAARYKIKLVKKKEKKKHKMNKQSKNTAREKVLIWKHGIFLQQGVKLTPATVKCEHAVGNFAYLRICLCGDL